MKTHAMMRSAVLGCRRFLTHAGGSLTIPALVFFVMLMGVGGLAIDLQRLYGVHGQMQAYVDDVALAGAAELDGQSDALSRAVKAACGVACDPSLPQPLVAGSAAFPDTPLSIQRITFLSFIDTDPDPNAPIPAPGNPTAPMDKILCWYVPPAAAECKGETVTSASAKAKFIEVIAAPRTVSYVVLPIANVFAKTFANFQFPPLQLRATAGFKKAVCNNTPLMVCNPAEAATPGAAFDDAAWFGHQIAAKLQGSSNWGPGNFGLLDTYPGNGASALRESMANVNPFTACTEDTIQVKTGQDTGPVQQGMNVRFDMYNGPYANDNNKPQYAPAPNVIKGDLTANGSCKNTQSAQTMPLPRDNCFMATPMVGGTGCTNYDGTARYGDGQWDRAAYWTQNHPMDAQPPGYIDPSKPTGGMSRYETYRYEITKQVNRDEKGAPSCSNQTPDTNVDRDRRILYVAVVNCVADAGKLGNGSVSVKAYVKVFLTEPVGNTAWSGKSRNGLLWPSISNDDVFIEIIGKVVPNDSSGHIHVYPVLYR